MNTKTQEDAAEKPFEEQMLQSAKLASLGELTAGVGHEINNPLTVIQFNTQRIKQILEKDPQASEEVLKLLSTVIKAATHIGTITKDLRVFVRSDDTKTSICDVVRAIENSLSLISGIYEKQQVKIYSKIQENIILHVDISEGKLQQVLINLFANAKDATENRSNRSIWIEAMQEENSAIITVKDNGCGIKPDNLKKIFNMFFTTKEIGKGTGIGLGITKRIIDQAKGEIFVESTIDVGTEFKIKLPLVKQQ